MRSAFFLCISLTLVFCLSACQKEKPAEIENVWLPKEIKDLFLFYPGSYWIMELPGTDFVDSVFVDSIRIDTLPIQHPGSREVVAYKERLWVRTVSPFYGWFITFTTESKNFCGLFDLDGPCHQVTRVLENGNLELVAQSFIYHYPELVGQNFATSAGFTDNYVRVDSIIPNYTQGDSSYKNVRKVIVNRDVTQQNQLSVRHFVPGIGQVRWQVPDFGFNWICVRYGVKQQPD